MTTVLITGVAGLLGSRFADWLIENQPAVQVIGLDDLSGGYEENIHPKVDFYHFDVGSPTLDMLFRSKRPDVVYHFAAYAAEGLSPFIRKFNYTNNVVATANLVNMCIKYGVKRLVFTSSMAVYGVGKPPFKETDVLNPIDPYGVAKMACEQDIKIAGDQHGLDWCIIRPHNVYGEKQNIWDAYRNVLGIWMYNILNGKSITVYGDGQQVRAFTHIDDILLPLWKAGTLREASKQIINLGGYVDATILEAAEIMKRVTGAKSEILFLPPRHEVKYAYPTWEKSVELLGFNQTTALPAGLTKMWDWAQQQPHRERFVWPSYEIDTGLYPYWKQEALTRKIQRTNGPSHPHRRITDIIPRKVDYTAFGTYMDTDE